MLPLLLAACFSPPPPADVVFVEGGLLVRGAEAGGRPVGAAGYRLDAPRAWAAGERVEVAGQGFVAPERPTCAPLWSYELGAVDRLVAGGGLPDTDVALSPEGDRVAVGTWRGAVVVLDAWTGEVLARRMLAESLVKRVVWSLDGKNLFAVEQSSDALLHALDPVTLTTRWSVRLADHVGTSQPPDSQDPYGAYQLPTAFGVAPLPDGSVVVAAGHGWPDVRGKRQNRGRMLRLNPDGTLAAAWPERAAEVIFQTLRVDGDRALVSVNHTADGHAPKELPDGGLLLLDLATLRVVHTFAVPPLGELFPRAWMWEAVDLDLSQDRVLLGLGDGRARLLDLAGNTVLDATPGTPVTAAGVPIAASVGFGALVGGLGLFVTSGTNIPWGAADPAARPPVPHPGAGSLFAWQIADGAAAWRWQGEHALEGLSVSPAGSKVAVGAGVRQGDDRRDLFGALRFDLTAAGAPEPVHCRTSSPVFFRHAVSDDGRVVVVEHPWSPAEGEVAGTWQVTLLR